jgi:hypothetical protein
MKRMIAFILAAALVFALAGCGKKPPKGNITALSFEDASDVTLRVGEAAINQKLIVEFKYRSDYKPEYVSFVSADPDIAGVTYLGNLIASELYFRIDGLAPGETEVWAEAEDGAVLSERIRVVVLAPEE